jgi:hypothetical protein
MGKSHWIIGADIGGAFADAIGANLESGETHIGEVSP